MSSSKNPPQKPQDKNKNQNSISHVGKIRHSGFLKEDPKQLIVQRAYQLGGYDLITLMECENGNRDIHTRGDGGYSIGICQMHTLYHDLPAEYYTSREKQVEVCYEKMKAGTKFYGPGRRVNGQRCSEFAKKRFYFE